MFFGQAIDLLFVSFAPEELQGVEELGGIASWLVRLPACDVHQDLAPRTLDNVAAIREVNPRPAPGGSVCKRRKSKLFFKLVRRQIGSLGSPPSGARARMW